MFDRSEGIRLTHSPSGGGLNEERQTTNPAWDFQFIIPDYEVATDYTFRARVFLQPRITRQLLSGSNESKRIESPKSIASFRATLKSRTCY